MSRPPCARPGCPHHAAYRVTGTNLRGPVDVCDQHLADTQRSAGIPRGTEAIHDDGVEALFDMPPGPKRAGLR